MDRLDIKGLSLWAYHGVDEAEARLGQTFIIDISCELDVHKASQEDDYASTVCYGDLCQRVLDLASQRRFKLIEALAAAVADDLLQAWPLIHSVSVSIHKPAAPVKAVVNDIIMTICRSRHD